MSVNPTVLERIKVVRENEVLLLDDPATVWAIQSGAVAVFVSEVQNGTLHDTRRYLFEAETGEALFGFATGDAPDAATSQVGSSSCILAVAIAETILLRVTLADLESDRIPDSNLTTTTVTGIELLTTWFEHLSSVFELTAIPLPPPQLSRPTPWETQQVILTNFHQQFFSSLQELDQQAQLENLVQFQARERLNREITTTAVAELVSLLEPQQRAVTLTGAPLLVAAGAVGRALGITIRPPAASEDLKRVKDPLKAIARASMMRIRRVLLHERWWRSDCGPLLGYLQADNTPVALLPVNNKYYEIYNPVTQRRTQLSDHTAKLLAPTAYMFYAPFPETKLDVLTLFGYSMRGGLREVWMLLFMGVAGALVGAIAPLATGILIDTAIPDANRNLLLQLTLALLAASFGTTICRLVQGLTLARLEVYSLFNTQAGMWDRLLKLPMSFFRDYSSGEVLARVSALNQIRDKLSGERLDALFNSLFALLNLGLLFAYSPSLVWVAVAVVFVTAFVTNIAGYFKRQKTLPLEELEGDILGMAIQLMSGISKLRTTGAEGRAYAYWAQHYRQQLKLMLGSQQIEDRIATFNLLQSSLTPMLIFSIAVSLIAQEQAASSLSTGTFLAFNAAFASFIAGVTSLSNNLVDLLDVAVLWEYAKPILETQPEIDLNKADPGRLSGYVKLDRVTFRYRQDGPLNLDDVTIEAKPGEFIALVGPSGSGKSTIFRMLLGFDVPEQGTVYYDGQDLAGLDVSAVRRQLGVVLQNGRINSETVFENISGGALIGMEEAWEAARMAGFALDIENMPMGMHTVISEGGANLSGGQRQRLLIARALVLKPRVILFDEATSALDNRTQAIVSESLEQLKVTRIAIAHRLSTIRNADRIYVIEAGRLVQQGTFEELANQDGLFAKLMAKQGRAKNEQN